MLSQDVIDGPDTESLCGHQSAGCDARVVRNIAPNYTYWLRDRVPLSLSPCVFTYFPLGGCFTWEFLFGLESVGFCFHLHGNSGLFFRQSTGLSFRAVKDGFPPISARPRRCAESLAEYATSPIARVRVLSCVNPTRGIGQDTQEYMRAHGKMSEIRGL